MRPALFMVGLKVTHSGDTDAHLLICLSCRANRIVGVHPGAVVPEADEFQQLGIQSFLLDGMVKQC